MKKLLVLPLSFLSLALVAPLAVGAGAEPSVRLPRVFWRYDKRYRYDSEERSQPRRGARGFHHLALNRRWPEYICYLTVDPNIKQTLLGQVEQARQDKQPGAPASGFAGSTSLVSKGELSRAGPVWVWSTED